MTTNKDLGARALGGLLVKVWDEKVGTRVAPAFTMLVNNFSAGSIIAGVLEERAQEVATSGTVAA